MGKLVDFLIFVLLVFFIVCLINGIKIHNLNETHMDKTFNISDLVYVLPDSTKAMVEDGWVVTDRQKDKITKIKKDVTVFEWYTITYKDNNGIIQRLKQVNSKFLIKRTN